MKEIIRYTCFFICLVAVIIAILEVAFLVGAI